VSHGAIEICTIHGRVSPAFGESRGGVLMLGQVNMDSTILTIVFTLDAHPLSTCQSAVVLDTPSLVILGP
jgi:hypothetical protein